MKALHTQGNVAFVSGFNKDSDNALNQAVQILNSHGYGDYKVRGCNLSNNKVLETNHNSITFIDGKRIDNYFWLKPVLDLICVDQPEQLKEDNIHSILRTRLETRKAFSTQPFNCAYRNPVYVNGVVVRDTEGNPLYKDYSWDKELLRWGKVDEENLSKKIITKLNPENYKFYVEVIMLDSPSVDLYSGNLSWEGEQLLKGEWDCEI
ncbi:hypothetical protein [Pseudoalteromonas phage PH357]|nr:hypothetical protein [Pseudoalteromonas phage PH357]